jgi:methyl-accepting chemotaxis protein
MTIRGRLVTAIVVTVAGLALTAGVGIWAMNTLGGRFDDVQKSAAARALALQLKFGITDVNGWQTAYGYDDGKSRETFLNAVEAFSADLERAHAQLSLQEEQALLESLQAAWDDFMALDEDAWAALQAGRTDQVRRIFLGPEIRNFRRAAAAADNLAAFEGSRADAADRRFRDSRSDALRLVLVAAIVTGLFVVILLVTAIDLVRRAERALEREQREAPASEAGRTTD